MLVRLCKCCLGWRLTWQGQVADQSALSVLDAVILHYFFLDFQLQPIEPQRLSDLLRGPHNQPHNERKPTFLGLWPYAAGKHFKFSFQCDSNPPVCVLGESASATHIMKWFYLVIFYHSVLGQRFQKSRQRIAHFQKKVVIWLSNQDHGVVAA